MIRNTRPPYLRSERSRALGQVKVGIVHAQVPSAHYKSVLRRGLPGDLIGVLVDGFGAILDNVFATVHLADLEPESSES